MDTILLCKDTYVFEKMLNIGCLNKWTFSYAMVKGIYSKLGGGVGHILS